MPLSAADVRPASACSSASNLAFATVPDNCEASMVLFVKVCEPDNVATVASIATERISVFVPVVVIPVPPCIVKLSPVVISWSSPPSPLTVKVDEDVGVPG